MGLGGLCNFSENVKWMYWMPLIECKFTILLAWGRKLFLSFSVLELWRTLCSDHKNREKLHAEKQILNESEVSWPIDLRSFFTFLYCTALKPLRCSVYTSQQLGSQIKSTELEKICNDSNFFAHSNVLWMFPWNLNSAWNIP